MRELDQLVKSLEQIWIRALIVELAVGLMLLIIFWWIAYLVTRAAVRDGIKDAIPRIPAPNNSRNAPPEGYRWELVKDDQPPVDLPEMRADR